LGVKGVEVKVAQTQLAVLSTLAETSSRGPKTHAARAATTKTPITQCRRPEAII